MKELLIQVLKEMAAVIVTAAASSIHTVNRTVRNNSSCGDEDFKGLKNDAGTVTVAVKRLYSNVRKQF